MSRPFASHPVHETSIEEAELLGGRHLFRWRCLCGARDIAWHRTLTAARKCRDRHVAKRWVR